MQTYLFYDIETTGLNKAFDQVLHFAAIRTDLNLKELDRYEIKIKLNPDVIPSPYALITHKMGINEITNGVPEFEAIKQIHQWLNTAGTISLGYNTLGFDDEFLRFSFYRNLLKPYTHQYMNQCYRMDIYPMTVMFYLFKNTAITWPINEKQVSFKLEKLNAANQFIAGRSHHAMIDVEVTLELARKLMAEREMWEYLHGYFKKEIDFQRTKPLEKDIALLVNGKLGSRVNYQCPVLFLGQHQHYKNQSIWLRLDTDNLTQTTPDTIQETTWGINKKPGEPNFILPRKERFFQHLTAKCSELMQRNFTWLQENPAMLEKITAHYIHFKYPVYPQTDVDANLYNNGFWTNEEELFCQRFHAAPLTEKTKLLKHATNPKLRMMALRILGRHYPSMLSTADMAEFADYMLRVNAPLEQDILIDYQGKKRLTPTAALQEIEAIKQEKQLDDADLKLLADFKDFLTAHKS